VEVTAARLATLVDELLGRSRRPEAAAPERAAEASDSGVVGCSCGSGIPVKTLTIAGQAVEVVALPLILEKVREAHHSPSEAATQGLLHEVKIYNYVAPDAEASWREVLSREFAAHCEGEPSR
jgi:hypothetical protein